MTLHSRYTLSIVLLAPLSTVWATELLSSEYNICGTADDMKCTWLESFGYPGLHIVYIPLVSQCLFPALHLWKQKMPRAALMQQTMHHAVHRRASKKNIHFSHRMPPLILPLKRKARLSWSWKWFRRIQWNEKQKEIRLRHEYSLEFTIMNVLPLLRLKWEQRENINYTHQVRNIFNGYQHQS